MVFVIYPQKSQAIPLPYSIMSTQAHPDEKGGKLGYFFIRVHYEGCIVEVHEGQEVVLYL